VPPNELLTLVASVVDQYTCKAFSSPNVLHVTSPGDIDALVNFGLGTAGEVVAFFVVLVVVDRFELPAPPLAPPLNVGPVVVVVVDLVVVVLPPPPHAAPTARARRQPATAKPRRLNNTALNI